MSLLTMIDGGSATLDLDKATIIYLFEPRYRDGIRTHEVWLFVDDKDRAVRLVLKVLHRATTACRRPRHGSCSIQLTTIYGYDPQNNRWGPSEHQSYMDIEWPNAKRLIEEIDALAQAEFTQLEGGHSWYRRK